MKTKQELKNISKTEISQYRKNSGSGMIPIGTKMKKIPADQLDYDLSQKKQM